MSILHEIAKHKIKEVNLKKAEQSIDDLQSKPLFLHNRKRLIDTKLAKTDLSIIAEFKRKSPSVSAINLDIDIKEVIEGYDLNDAWGISVLTDHKYFGGGHQDIIEAGFYTAKPLLRKDFIIDEYQLYESKTLGASVVLLIAAILTKEQVYSFAVKAKELHMDVLLEIHDKEELKFYNQHISAVGVNNRNLKTFKVDCALSKELIKYLPKDVIKISESGLKKAEDVAQLMKLGYDGFLIGERFMKSSDPGREFSHFTKAVNQLL